MRRVFILALGFFILVNSLSAFTLNFVVSFGNGDFQTANLTPTNGIEVNVITFNSFTPVVGQTTFQEILDNSTVLVTGVTSNDFDIPVNPGSLGINVSDVNGFEGDELYAFANFNGQEFGLWRNNVISDPTTDWIGRNNLNDTTLFMGPSGPSGFTITAFAGSFDDTGNHFILEAVPEPSTYALMGLGGLALMVGYGRKKGK